jgi:hypothetical protein
MVSDVGWSTAGKGQRKAAFKNFRRGMGQTVRVPKEGVGTEVVWWATDKECYSVPNIIYDNKFYGVPAPNATVAADSPRGNTAPNAPPTTRSPSQGCAA